MQTCPQESSQLALGWDSSRYCILHLVCSHLSSSVTQCRFLCCSKELLCFNIFFEKSLEGSFWSQQGMPFLRNEVPRSGRQSLEAPEVRQAGRGEGCGAGREEGHGLDVKPPEGGIYLQARHCLWQSQGVWVPGSVMGAWCLSRGAAWGHSSRPPAELGGFG